MRRELAFSGALLVASALTALAPSALPTAKADTIHLLGGRVIEGSSAMLEGENVSIEAESGRISVPLGNVKYLVRGRSPLAVARERETALAKDDVEGRLRLADFCRDQGLFVQERWLLERVVALAPAQPEARRRLGFVQTEAGWVQSPELIAQLERERGALTELRRRSAEQRADLELALARQNQRRAEVVGRESMVRVADRLNRQPWRQPWLYPYQYSVFPPGPGQLGWSWRQPNLVAPLPYAQAPASPDRPYFDSHETARQRAERQRAARK